LRTLLVCAMMLIACIVSGCVVVTLQPLYTSDTLTFDPALIGAWQNTEKDTTYTFSDNGEGGYKLSITPQKGTTTLFAFHLVKLGDRLFADMYPDITGRESLDGYTWWNMAPVHNVFLIKSIRPTLRYKALSTEWLDEYLAANPQAIAHGRIDLGPDDEKGLPALTADTPELQAFFLKLADTPKAWNEAELVPVAPASQAAP